MSPKKTFSTAGRLLGITEFIEFIEFVEFIEFIELIELALA